VAFLKDLAVVEPECQCVIGRELTKIHEEVLRGSPAALHLELSARPAIKGEFAVLMHPPFRKTEKSPTGSGLFQGRL